MCKKKGNKVFQLRLYCEELATGRGEGASSKRERSVGARAEMDFSWGAFPRLGAANKVLEL